MESSETQNEKPIPLMVRLPPNLHGAVKDEANQEHRSLNAQFISLIEYALACKRQQNPTHHRAPTP